LVIPLPVCGSGMLVGGRRTAFLVRAWGCVGVVLGAGRRGSVACRVAQRAQLGAFRLVFTFLYFRCSLDACLVVSSLCLCAGVLPCMA